MNKQLEPDQQQLYQEYFKRGYLDLSCDKRTRRCLANWRRGRMKAIELGEFR